MSEDIWPVPVQFRSANLVGGMQRRLVGGIMGRPRRPPAVHPWPRCLSVCPGLHRRLRGHLALTQKNQSDTPWCCPTVLALATGQSYAAACALLRAVARSCYEPEGPIVTAYWRDLLSGLDRLSIAHVAVAPPERRKTLLTMVRWGLPVDWYLLRVTDHFLLLRSHGFGLATLHDNRHTGALVTGHTHGRRHVTHVTRLLGGPLAAPPEVIGARHAVGA
jgi:hypothetical protein